MAEETIYSITYTITTRSPVVITTQTGDRNTVTTCPYLPGSTLLGVFAHRYLDAHPLTLPQDIHTENAGRFRAWFLNGDLTFTNAYPLHPQTGTVHFPAPLSIRQEKHKEPIPDKGGRTIVDLLFEDPQELVDVQTKAFTPKFMDLNGERLSLYEAPASLAFHHRRDKTTGTTEQGGIFTYQSLDAGQPFRGQILGAEQVLQSFMQIVGAQTREARIGRSKSAQYGQVEIRFATPQPQVFHSEIPALNRTPPLLKETEIVMTLLADMILVNEYGFATTDLAPLEEQLRQAVAPEVTIRQAVIKTGETETFLAVWGLPRPAEACLKAGSTFLLHVPAGKVDALRRLQRQGIGERRNEGFGRVVFGWQQEATEGLWEPPPTTQPLQAPTPPLPELTVRIVRATIIVVLRKRAQVQAMDQARKFLSHHPPTKSLLGRLEAMAAASATRETFLAQLGTLRKTACDQLEHCRTDKETLGDFLRTYPLNMTTLMASHKDLLPLSQAIGFTPEHEPNIRDELYHEYLTTLFAMMRKQLGTVKGGV